MSVCVCVCVCVCVYIDNTVCMCTCTTQSKLTRQSKEIVREEPSLFAEGLLAA